MGKGRASKNQMGGMRGAGRAAWYLPDRDTLPRYNYSNGAGWRTKNPKNISFGIHRLGEGRRKHRVGT